MILIADAGSTKIEWSAVGTDGCVKTFETPGVNAVMLDEASLREFFAAALRGLQPDSIYYYGAGCVTPQVCNKVRDALPSGAYVEVESDMLGAARALLGNEPGLAAIMGTGSNSALYDGRKLVSNMPPLGYIIGDEGSGAALGKRMLLLAYRSGAFRPDLERHLGMNYGEILDRVYRRPEANVFLASLVPFILERREHLSDMISAELDAFFAAIAKYYPLERRISIAGGLAAALGPDLTRAAAMRGFTIDKIQDRPLAGLITYHTFHGK